MPPRPRMLRRGHPSVPLIERILRDAPKDEDADRATRRIRCPRCEWVPAAGSRWSCVDQAAPEYFTGGCGTSWNTFETGGRCPGCGHVWQWTACLRCEQWSPHEDWYFGEEPQ